MRRGRRRPPRGEETDSVGLAGWLYTDLLLGLAVVFLGGLAFLVPKELAKPTKDPTANPAASTTTIVRRTTTTSTLPVKLCRSLYVPTDRKENGITIAQFNINGNDDGVRNRFASALKKQLDEENARLESLGDTQNRFDIETVEIGMVLYEVGSDYEEEDRAALRNAKGFFDRLLGLLPTQFKSTKYRSGISRQYGRGLVTLEVIPFIDSPC